MVKKTEDLLHEAIYGRVKWKRNSTQNLRFIARKIVNKRNIEVMLKVSGHSKAGVNLSAHIDYITRNKKIELENESGAVFSGKEDTKRIIKQWEEDVASSKKHYGNDAIHLVLSMPSEIKPEAVKNATRDFLKKNFYNHDYLFVLHTDSDGGNPHTHCVIKTLDFDNKRLNRPNRIVLQKWRESFAAEMQNQGVENAEATPRKSRGVIKQSENKLIRRTELQIEKKNKKSPEPELFLTPENKQAWLDAAQALDEEGNKEDKDLSKEIRKFVADIENEKPNKSKSIRDDFER
jgi:hypothetical protein